MWQYVVDSKLSYTSAEKMEHISKTFFAGQLVHFFPLTISAVSNQWPLVAYMSRQITITLSLTQDTQRKQDFLSALYFYQFVAPSVKV